MPQQLKKKLRRDQTDQWYAIFSLEFSSLEFKFLENKFFIAIYMPQ